MIEVNGISKKYGSHYALKNVSFKAGKGDMVGVLGRTGAGKTTLMDIITGCIIPSSGNVTVDGYDVFKKPIDAKKRIGYLPQSTPLYEKMTVKEQLMFACRLMRVPEKKLHAMTDMVMEKAKITDVGNDLIGNLSNGLKRAAGLACTLCGDPEILIFDEPTDGLAPEQIIEIRTTIRSLKHDHTVILASHSLHEVAEVCEKVVIINKGEIVLEDMLGNVTSTVNDQRRVMVRLVTDKKSGLRLLNGIDGADNVEYIGSKEQGTCDFIVESLNKDVREKIFHAAAKADIVLLCINSMSVTLQDIFLQLTGEDKEMAV
ncbi:MAG: ABC transporter ATP-binding protein [Eubacteriales bacterium]|nr:ABC transporter ATP-binding protein [Eubacteriales bacterium]